MTRATPEWIGAHPDVAIPPRVKVRIFDRDGGRCKECTRKVGPGFLPFAFDHITALVNSGQHRETNLQLLCDHCHKVKTEADVGEKKIVRRKRAKHLGIAKPKSGLSHPRFKRKMDGTVVNRETGETV
jgi:5-methylcytosine-specific restriction protein A